MKVIRTDAGRWLVRYRDPEGRQREKTFARKADAESFGHGVESDKRRGSYVDPNAGRITFAAYAADWMVAQPHRPSTADTYKRHLKNHIEPVFGKRQLMSLRPTEIQAWVTSLNVLLKPSTVHTVYGIFASILRAAVRDDRLRKSPCQGIKLPPIPKTKIVILEPAEITRLADKITASYKAMILLAAGAGLRQGEAFAISTDSVKWLERTVVVDRSLSLVTGSKQGPVIGPTKTQASNRTVPLAQHVLDALSVHIQVYPPSDNSLLFTTRLGNPLRRGSFNKSVWKPALKKAGLPSDVTFHDLRHSFASIVIKAGATPKEVQAWMGHATIGETFDTYGHLFPDAADNARRFIDEAFAPPVSTPQSRTAQ